MTNEQKLEMIFIVLGVIIFLITFIGDKISKDSNTHKVLGPIVLILTIIFTIIAVGVIF